MKAVIVEIKNSFAAALCDDGCIIKIKNNNYGIGQVIDMKQHAIKNLKYKKVIGFVATVATAAMVYGASALAYYTPYSYVSLDVNPSVEYSLNIFERVISAEAVNDDGAEILADLDLTNKTIEEAIQKTVAEISDNGYLDNEATNAIMITTYSPNDEAATKLAETLKEEVVAETTAETKDVEVEANSIAKDRVLEAKELGVTPGKLNLVQKLQASSVDPNSINIEEWLNKPVKEIMKATKANKKAAKALEKETVQNTETTTTESSEATTQSTEATQTESTTAELETIKAIEKTELESIKAIEKKEIEKIKQSSKTAAQTTRESSKAEAEAIRESIKADVEIERESSKASAEAIRESIKADAEAERESIKADAEAERESVKADAETERDNNKADAEAERENNKSNNEKSDNADKSNGKNK